MTVSRKWSFLAAVLAVAMAAAGWFLLVSPKRSEAADIRSQAAAREASNSQLVQRLEVLKAQQAELPAQRAALAKMRTQIPDNPALPSLIRSLTKAGRQVGVTIDSMAPAPPSAVVTAGALGAPAAVAPAPAAEGTSTADAPATATAPAATQNPLYQVTLALSVTGSYFELEQFVDELEGLKRSFLVSGFTLAPAAGTGGDTSTASDPGAPAPGDLTLALEGRVYMAPPVAAAVVAPPTTTTPAQ